LKRQRPSFRHLAALRSDFEYADLSKLYAMQLKK
jgi:hypothetical protein